MNLPVVTKTSAPSDDAERLALCAGCRDNFYNDNNPLGVKRCWHLANMQLAEVKWVHVDAPPPWENAPVIAPTCMTRERYVRMHPLRRDWGS